VSPHSQKQQYLTLRVSLGRRYCYIRHGVKRVRYRHWRQGTSLRGWPLTYGIRGRIPAMNCEIVSWWISFNYLPGWHTCSLKRMENNIWRILMKLNLINALMLLCTWAMPERCQYHISHSHLLTRSRGMVAQTLVPCKLIVCRPMWQSIELRSITCGSFHSVPAYWSCSQSWTLSKSWLR